tara:strand:+ start:1596 stop:2909 length:1314 start_codon:yes stop_codon:yes gene_type:complete
MFFKKFLNFVSFERKELTFTLFLLGIFFLASAPSVSFIILLFPIFSGLKKNFKSLIKDNLNYLLIIAGFIMISKSIVTSFFGTTAITNWDSILNWTGIGNWIPHFLIYFGAQFHVDDPKKRSLIAKTLILGTVPVIFSCFTQYFLKWYGPYELFNGFIIWYQRSRENLNQPVTGLFNNPNYTGAWLAMTWPFLLSYLYQKRKEGHKLQFMTIFALSVLFIFTICLINSRGAFLGILASIPIIFGKGVIAWLLPILMIILLSITLCALPIIPENIRNIFCFLIPNSILSNFNDLSLTYENIPRLVIWEKAVNLIIKKPFFGWGAASFPILYFTQYGEWKGHPHNLLLELSISYGLITSILVFTFVGILVFRTFKIIHKLKISKSSYDRAWWTSVIVFLILHSFDIVYFDARISIIFWILLAGLKGILDHPENSEPIKT